MATGGDTSLSDGEIEALARNIITKHMATIAMKDLGIGYETIENLKIIKQNDFIGYNRDLLVLWRNKNPGINQVRVSYILRQYIYHIYHSDCTLYNLSQQMSCRCVTSNYNTNGVGN